VRIIDPFHEHAQLQEGWSRWQGHGRRHHRSQCLPVSECTLFTVMIRYDKLEKWMATGLQTVGLGGKVRGGRADYCAGRCFRVYRSRPGLYITVMGESDDKKAPTHHTM
jgi:hypothetical protein